MRNGTSKVLSPHSERKEKTMSQQPQSLFVSHLSALRYWRQSEGLRTTSDTRVRSLASAISNIKDARNLNPKAHGLIMSKDYPLDVLVSSKQERRYAKELQPHPWSSEVPDRAFRQVTESLFVSSPEFLFIQLAKSLSLVELAQVGNELCGGYYLLSSSGFCERPSNEPITTRKKLLSFVKRAPNSRGTKKALRALAWVADHCNSPMETNTLLVLCLPKRLGGWSLPMPKVNFPFEVSERMSRYVRGKEYIPDFTWTRKVNGRQIYITGEYDSHENHDETRDAEHTRIRRNDMKSMGFWVTSINRSQMASAESFQYPARQIARDLGLYRRVPKKPDLQRQDELMKQLRCESFR